MKVQLLDYCHDPLEKLYTAFRTCYSQDDAATIWNKVKSEAIPPDKIKSFILERLKTGHASPLQQIVFWYSISDVSRALSHQFVRHHLGLSIEQASQRYIKYNKLPDTTFIMPKSWDEHELDDRFRALMYDIHDLYQAALKVGIPAEDARFVLPNATPTNLCIMINYLELQHIADLRLCIRAQWEIRRMVALMRAEIKRVIPELAVYIQPKCGEHRLGYCDESLEDYKKCPLRKVRPHKEHLFKIYYETMKAFDGVPPSDLSDEQYKEIEDKDGIG